MKVIQPAGNALIEAAAALHSSLFAAAAETERNGRLAPPLLDALHDAGFFRMLLPRSLGGLEIEPAVFVEVLEALAAADASTAWVVAQGCGCSLAAAYLAPDVAREIFGPGDAVLAWGPSGTGAKAVTVEGGYRVSGQLAFRQRQSLCAVDRGTLQRVRGRRRTASRRDWQAGRADRHLPAPGGPLVG